MATGFTTTVPLQWAPRARSPRPSMRRTEAALTRKYADRLRVNTDLDRRLVSFQANKGEAEHRWYKYKEGFSASLVRYILSRVGPREGRLLDPFAGSGTALFCGSEFGLDSVGIELLPIGAEIVEVRKLLLGADRKKLVSEIVRFCEGRPWEKEGPSRRFRHLRITRGAFPTETERKLGRYLHEAENVSDGSLSTPVRNYGDVSFMQRRHPL